MDFYKKQGAGRLSIEEQALIDDIKRVVAEKGIRPEAVPKCNCIEDLIYAKQFVDELDDHPDRQTFEDFDEDEFEERTETEQFEHEAEQLEAEEVEAETEIVERHETEEKERFISEDYNPFADPIIERSYNQAGGGSITPDPSTKIATKS